MQTWMHARDKVRWPKLGWRVQPNERDLGRSGPRCLPPTSTSYCHSLKPSRLTPSDLSSLIRSKQEDWRQSDFTKKNQKKHSLRNKQRGFDSLLLTYNHHSTYHPFNVIKLIICSKKRQHFDYIPHFELCTLDRLNREKMSCNKMSSIVPGLDLDK